MDDFKHIVVGLDLVASGDAVAAGSQRAAQQAIWLAGQNSGSIRFVHSTRPAEVDASEAEFGLSEAGTAALGAIAQQARDAGIESELVITAERSWFHITKIVLQSDVDLVIVGKRSEHSEDGRQLGGVATKLLRKCPCAVWVVNPQHELEHKRILAATDLTDVGDRAVVLAGELAQRRDCELHVVHAWSMPMSLQVASARMSDEEHAAELERIKHKVITHVEGLLGDGAPLATVHTACGAPSQMITDAVSHLNPDLLVMGTVSRSGIAGLLIGSTAERMIDQVVCSILTLKPRDFESPVSA